MLVFDISRVDFSFLYKFLLMCVFMNSVVRLFEVLDSLVFRCDSYECLILGVGFGVVMILIFLVDFLMVVIGFGGVVGVVKGWGIGFGLVIGVGVGGVIGVGVVIGG